MGSEVPIPPEIPLELPKPAPKKRRTKLYIGVVLAGILIVSVLLIGFSIKQFSGQQTEQISSILTIDAPSAIKGKPCTIKAILEDENENPIRNVDVEFQIYEGGLWKNIGSAKTNSSGIASISYTPLTAGTFQVKAIFKGTTNYAQSSSTVVALNVSVDYGPLNVYVQQLKEKGFEVSQGTWKQPQYYAEIPDFENFIKWAEQAREQHRQRGEDDPVIYVDIEHSVFWFIGRIALFNYDDVTFYWFV